MHYFQRDKKNLKLTSGSILQYSEKYFKAIHIKELHFKQGECELDDLTVLLIQSLLKAKMFVNLFKIASWKHEKHFPNLYTEAYRVVED